MQAFSTFEVFSSQDLFQVQKQHCPANAKLWTRLFLMLQHGIAWEHVLTGVRTHLTKFCCATMCNRCRCLHLPVFLCSVPQMPRQDAGGRKLHLCEPGMFTALRRLHPWHARDTKLRTSCDLFSPLQKQVCRGNDMFIL